MGLPKFSSVSILSLAGVVLLVGGLGIAIFASQHQQDTKSHAANSCSGTCRLVGLGCQSGETNAGAGLCGDLRGAICCVPNTSGGGCTGDACYIGKSCSTPQGSGSCQYLNSYNCSGSWVKNYCPGSTNVVCCVPGSQPPPPASTPTIFNLNLLLHGIGKAGDNANANGGGNTSLKNPTRSVLVAVYDLNNQPIIAGQLGQVTYDSDLGGYKGQVAMGTTLQNQAYVIKVKMSDSLWGEVTRTITAGGSNDIPQMKLINGDANGDGQADNDDYKIIVGCYSDFGQPAKDCDDTRKAQADIDDDGDVNQFDLNLFLREMSVQQ